MQNKSVKKWIIILPSLFIFLILMFVLVFNLKGKSKFLNKNKELSQAKSDMYSIIVKVYKELSDAEHDRERLRAKKFNPYIIKTYDDKKFFSFWLCVSPYDKRDRKQEDEVQDEIINKEKERILEEARERERSGDEEPGYVENVEKVIKQKFAEKRVEEKAKDLQNEGIKPEAIYDYSIVEAKALQYDSVVCELNVAYEIPKTVMPEFSKHVITCIKQFPINRDFRIQELYIFDVENMRAFGEDNLITDIAGGGGGHSGAVSNFMYDLCNDKKTLAASVGLYRDVLYDKLIKIVIKTGHPGSFSLQNDVNAYHKEFSTLAGVINCNVNVKKIMWNISRHELRGVNEDGSFYIEMESEFFTEEEFNLFLNNIKNDSGLLVYPQIRKNLLILPKEKKNRDFLTFSLTEIPESYAIKKGATDWAMAMVGHWDSSIHFNINNENISILSFDLEYDYIAEKVEKMFVRDRKVLEIDDDNQSIELKNTTGWFISNGDKEGEEISFYSKSYSMAVDSYASGKKDILVELVNDLQIWR